MLGCGMWAPLQRKLRTPIEQTTQTLENGFALGMRKEWQVKFYFVLFSVGISGACLIFLFLQPRTASELTPPDPLMERASGGDIEAIKAMILRTEKNSQSHLPNYWLYKGALAGDATLVAEFEAQFRALSDEHKRAEIQNIRTSAASVDLKNVILKRLSEIYPEGFKNEPAPGPEGR